MRVRVVAASVPGPTVVQLDALPAPAVASQPGPQMPKSVTSRGRPGTGPKSASLINWNAGPPKPRQADPVHRVTIQHPAWLHDFLLDLGAPDPNRDLRIELPVTAPV